LPGMSTGLGTNNPVVVSAFYNELLRQGLVAAAILLVVGIAWSVLRSVQLRRVASGEAGATTALTLARSEPVARRLLRVSFGLLWIFDGILQGQASMPLGMAPQVIGPAAASSPGWVQHLVDPVASIWSYHPVSVPAAAVWIQVGIGLWLLAAPRGTWSRLGGVASVTWGLIVWIFGEAFGQIFSPGQSWLFGLPGGVLFYCVAGALVALPESAWSTPRLGRWILRCTGIFWLGMALLQAWPGRGFWQGQPTRTSAPGSLTTMVQQMAGTPQPHALSSLVTAFGKFDAAHGWGVNLFSVVALAAIGVLFLMPQRRLLLAGVVAGTVLCLADWVLVEDFGFLGGVGTDPNSMVPMALVFIAGYLAVTRLPAPAPASEPNTAAAVHRSWQERLAANPTYTFRCVAAAGALGVTLLGTATMALAATSPHSADPILAQAFDGTPEAFDFREPAVSLVDQFGRPVSLASLRGKAVALTFLDPVCTTDCPVIALEFRQADTVLGADARRVDLVAICANPRFIATEYLDAFDRQEGLARVPNWLFLTGSLPQLEHAWRALGAEVQYLPGGSMVDHSEFAYVIDPSGHVRYDIDTDPGPATNATQASVAVALAANIKTVLRTR
jgi:cytochrome oxidase Cu insertion factor (SCO1/SenC/PrrC family)